MAAETITRRRAGSLVAAAALMLAVAAGGAPALAHQLNVFAFVEGETVVVEVTFSNGRAARSGSVEVFDGNDVLVHRTSVGEDGTARFPLVATGTGLRIEVDAGDGHQNYWVLTPQDIAAQRAAAVAGY